VAQAHAVAAGGEKHERPPRNRPPDAVVNTEKSTVES
jgi:hypothetical protein